MAFAGGPSSYLPGHHLHVPADAMCDNHPTTPACARIVGEVDSMGFEASDLCYACVERMQEQEKEENKCDLCGCLAVLTPTRDPEEGSSGSVYNWCSTCRTTVFESFASDRNPVDNSPDDYYEPLDHDNT